MYFKESVADNKDKPKKLWGLLKDLGSSNKCKTKITNIGLKIKDTICFDKLAVELILTITLVASLKI